MSKQTEDSDVWNATNVTRQIGAKVLGLLRNYGARIEIVYIEVPADRLFAQNAGRTAVVPGRAVVDLVRKPEPPEPWEAHRLIRVVDPT